MDTSTTPTPQNNLLSNSPGTSPGTSSSSHFVSLIQDVFGGKMRTSYRCAKCHSESIHREIFTELHLAIPDVKSEEKKKETANDKEEKKSLTMQDLLKNYLKSEKLEVKFSL